MAQDEKERGRKLLAKISDGMEVVDTDGTRVGTVARVEGGHLKIIRADLAPRNAHQFVGPELIAAVDDRVHLSHSWDELRRLWHAEDEFAHHHYIQRPI